MGLVGNQDEGEGFAGSPGSPSVQQLIQRDPQNASGREVTELVTLRMDACSGSEIDGWKKGREGNTEVLSCILLESLEFASALCGYAATDNSTQVMAHYVFY